MEANVELLRLLLIALVTTLNAFNIDTRDPRYFSGPEGSYFGYTVGILSEYMDHYGYEESWMLIGAPLADDPDLPELDRPGVLYKCSWVYSSCERVEVDDNGNIRQIVPKWKNVTLHHSKNKQWLAATLDINVHGDHGVVVCAPRWRDREFFVQGHEFMNGLCYEGSSQLVFNDSSSWPVLESFRQQIHAAGHYIFGMGALGFSAEYSKDGEFLVMGAPGVNDWTGGLVRIDGGHRSRPKIYEPSRRVYNNSYIGYDVTTARLSSDAVFVIAGGPRAENKGKVFVYDYNFDVMLVLEGDQFGSYFGASVCAADLNGDGLDDLVVAAPLFSNVRDEGQVYIYINKEFFNLDLEATLSGSNSPGARFGTTVANIGDINRDGFQDIAVGAPFEQQERGVLYIYNGAKSGIHKEVSQRIAAIDLSPRLYNFGWSISRPMDVDKNQYDDILIGAFASDNAVLLRTQPVINLQVHMEIYPQIIRPEGHPNCLYQGAPAMCIQTKICGRYDGVNVPERMDIEVTLNLDTLDRHRNVRKRLFVQDTGRHLEVDTVKKPMWLSRGQEECMDDITIFTRKSRDVITPLKLELEHKIRPGTTGVDKHCDICAVLNKYQPQKIETQAMYERDCGANNVCASDVSLLAFPRYDDNVVYLVLDDSPVFEIEIELYNRGETAYLTVVTLNFPDVLRYSRVKRISGNSDVMCLSQTDPDIANDTARIECDVENPLEKGDEVIFSLRFYPPKAWHHDEIRNFNFTIVATTASQETNLHNNHALILVPVKLESKVQISDVSLPAQMIFSPNPSINELEWKNVKHVFGVRNYGPSMYPSGHLVILFPVSPYLIYIDHTVDPPRTRCRFTHTSMSYGQTAATSSPTRLDSTGRESYKPVLLTCTETNCMNITCPVNSLHVSEEFFVTINFKVKRSILKDLDVKRELRIVSNAKLFEPYSDKFISLTRHKNASASTYITAERTGRKGFRIWILAVSIVSGLLLLYLIGVILWKCGFFRRRKREELQKLIQSSESEREAMNTVNLPGHDPVNDVMVLPANNHFTPTHEEVNFNNNVNNHWPPPHPAFSNDTYLEPINMRS